MSAIQVLPLLRAARRRQMALDDGLLGEAEERRRASLPVGAARPLARQVPEARRASRVCRSTSCGGPRAAGRCCTARTSSGPSPWSSRPASLGCGTQARASTSLPYELVSRAFAAAFGRARRHARRAGARSRTSARPLCFASSLRHDLAARGEKLVAIAQARRDGRVLVHGSVLERRPAVRADRRRRDAARRAVAGRGAGRRRATVDGEMLWRRVLARLDAGVRLLRRGGTLARRRRRGGAMTGRRARRRSEPMTRILVLGGGPAGYVAALRAAQLGARRDRGRGARDRRDLPEPRLHPDQGDGGRRRAPALRRARPPSSAS